MSRKNEQFAYRLCSILERLNRGERLNVGELAGQFQVSKRTIQRDLNQRLEFLQWNEQGPDHYSLDKSKIGHLLPEDIQRFARFCSISNLLPQIDRRFYQEQLTRSIKIKGFQYEDIKPREAEFDSLHSAIENHCQIEFHYTKAGADNGKYYRLEPYALVNRNGIWYLIGMDIGEGRQKTFCFSQIRSISRLSQHFTPNPELLAAIAENDSIYHGSQLSEIVVQVAPKAAPYFLRRDLLPNQELVRKLDDGGLLLACKNVHEMDVVPVVQYWIPHLSIISPVGLQDKLHERLRQYLDSNKAT